MSNGRCSPDSGHPTPRDNFDPLQGPSHFVTSTPIPRERRTVGLRQKHDITPLSPIVRHSVDEQEYQAVNHVINVVRDNKKLREEAEELRNESFVSTSHASALENELENKNTKIKELEDELSQVKNKVSVDVYVDARRIDDGVDCSVQCVLDMEEREEEKKIWTDLERKLQEEIRRKDESVIGSEKRIVEVMDRARSTMEMSERKMNEEKEKIERNEEEREYRITQFELKLEDSQKRCDSAEKRINELEKENEEKEMEREREKNELDEEKRRVIKFQQKIDDAVQTIAELEKSINFCKDENETLRNDLEKMKELHEERRKEGLANEMEGKREIMELGMEKCRLEGELMEMKEKTEKGEKRKEELMKEREKVVRIEKELEEEKKEEEIMRQEMMKIQYELEVARRESQRQREESRILKEEKRKWEEEKEKMKNDMTIMKDKIDRNDAEEKIEWMMKEKEERERRLDETMNELTTIRQEMMTLKTHYHDTITTAQMRVEAEMRHKDEEIGTLKERLVQVETYPGADDHYHIHDRTLYDCLPQQLRDALEILKQHNEEVAMGLKKAQETRLGEGIDRMSMMKNRLEENEWNNEVIYTLVQDIISIGSVDGGGMERIMDEIVNDLNRIERRIMQDEGEIKREKRKGEEEMRKWTVIEKRYEENEKKLNEKVKKVEEERRRAVRAFEDANEKRNEMIQEVDYYKNLGNAFKEEIEETVKEVEEKSEQIGILIEKTGKLKEELEGMERKMRAEKRELREIEEQLEEEIEVHAETNRKVATMNKKIHEMEKELEEEKNKVEKLLRWKRRRLQMIQEITQSINKHLKTFDRVRGRNEQRRMLLEEAQKELKKNVTWEVKMDNLSIWSENVEGKKRNLLDGDRWDDEESKRIRQEIARNMDDDKENNGSS